MFFAEEGDGGVRMFSRAAYRAWRPLELAGGVTTAVCGFSKLAENFFKKVLDRNRRSVSIVDAPFTGN